MPATQIMVNVEAKVFGKRKPLFTDWQPQLTLPMGETTLQDLIAAVVTSEVAAFHERQEQRHLARVLTPAQINQGAASGKIDAGGQDEAQIVAVEDAVAVALQGFADGLYFVFVDAQQITTLEQQVAVHEGSHLLFVRLVALVGG